MTAEDIVLPIQARLAGAEVLVRDLTGDGNHFEAVVVSDLFEGVSRLERHRIVLGALGASWNGPLHALTFKTFTKQEWEKV